MPGVVGIDAGGSHTRAVRVARDGTLLAEGTAGPANTFFVPVADARRHIETCARGVLEETPTPEAGCITGPHLPPDTLNVLEAAAPSCEWVVVSEEAACRAAVFGAGTAPGCIVLCGTGTLAVGRWPGGQRVRRGGWGPLVGDEGSGTLIALEGLRAVVRAAEGLGPRTALTESMLAACGFRRVVELKEFLYRPLIARDRLASLCPVVARTAEAGDAIAHEILTAAGRAVAELAATTLLAPEAPNPDIPTAFFGGVIRNVALVADACRTHLTNRVPETAIEETPLLPVDGAVAVAFQTAHRDPALAMQTIGQRRRGEREVVS